MGLGFRSPEQTLQTFQAGVRGDLPRLEYRCFSMDYRARKGLSQLAYRELRERALSPNPWFKLGVAGARIVVSERQGPGRWRLVVENLGRSFELLLVAEEFWQLWQGTLLVADEVLAAGSFSSAVELLTPRGAPRTVIAGAELPAHIAPLADAPLTEFRVALEWKIDDIFQLEP
jgi:hypothetical protein